MTNILVPTDFSPESLKLADAAIKQSGKVPCNIILFHAFDLPASPHDLLGTTKQHPQNGLVSEAFRRACQQLKKEWGKELGAISVQCMRGNSRNLFRNFIDAHDIDLVYCPEGYVFEKVHTDSLDPLYFFKKCGIPVIKTAVQSKERIAPQPYFIVPSYAHG